MTLCEVAPKQKAPGAHTPHTLAPAAENRPGAHAVDAVAPARPLKAPAGVARHADAPVALENEPTAHATGAELAAAQ
jgi:hypothetical protein